MFRDYILFIYKTYQVCTPFFPFVGNEIQLQYLQKTGTVGWKWEKGGEISSKKERTKTEIQGFIFILLLPG